MVSIREAVGDLWTYQCNARCVNTNGIVKRDGSLVMGRGIALEAAQRYPDLPKMLGRCVRAQGNLVFSVWPEGSDAAIVSFPTKYHWSEGSKLDLIERSAHRLLALTNEMKWNVVVLPWPGCGNGGLKPIDVRPVIGPILDDRFVVLTLRK